MLRAPTLKHISGTSGRVRLPCLGREARWASGETKTSFCGWRGQKLNIMQLVYFNHVDYWSVFTTAGVHLKRIVLIINNRGVTILQILNWIKFFRFSGHGSIQFSTRLD